MSAIDIKKSDWKLFRERLPEWQEKYMERLVEEYVELLKSDALASDKFWELEERIKQDKRKPGVHLTLEKKNVDIDLKQLIKDEVIGFKDLDGFSPELIDRVVKLYHMKW